MSTRAAGMLQGMFLAAMLFPWSAGAETLPNTIARVKQSIVGVGTVMPTRRPPGRFLATGFVIGEGRYVFTNAHAIPDLLDSQNNEHLAIFVKNGGAEEMRFATQLAVDEEHDLSLLIFSGASLPAMSLAKQDDVKEGEIYAFTGFPIGGVLGLIPVTHHGMISAITPIALPAQSAQQLDIKLMQRLRRPFDVYQLDGTAYPGNSGSPLYDVNTGVVVGVLNMVFVKESKEAVLEKPSGISYAIPVKYARELLAVARHKECVDQDCR